jgi:hypothetical protein
MRATFNHTTLYICIAYTFLKQAYLTEVLWNNLEASNHRHIYNF